MTIKQTIYKIKVNICRFLFNDILKDFAECDYELGHSDGYKACMRDYNIKEDWSDIK